MLNQSVSPTMEAAIPFSTFSQEVLAQPGALRHAITAAYRRDEPEALQYLLSLVKDDPASQIAIQTQARALVQAVRAKRTRASGVDALMHEFSLSSEEGIALMCLAEALLRIPDNETADRLIADKISKGDWKKHLGESPSLFVNAATWGLLITGKLVSTNSEEGLGSAIGRLITKGGEPLIRKGVDLAMRMLGNQFVTGQTIEEALANSRDNEARGYRYSYDMLGEAALTEHDAQLYYQSYEAAIHAIGKAAAGRGIRNGPGISVKLSALHPRYSRAQRSRVMGELVPRLKSLLLLAKQYDIGLNIDAEETDRLELSLDMLEVLAFDADLAGFDGIGFVVQAYQKRCPYVIDYLIDLSKRSGRKFMVRLVKGAYWDAEIKRSQVDGMPGFPVYTRKVHTDVSYLACAQKLLDANQWIYPQFATHNAHSLSAIFHWAKDRGVDDYEFQCLYGMGETLYDQVVGSEQWGKPCRIYAPVGSHQTLLAYLVRRLLENGANSSFVNQIVDEDISVDALTANPIDTARATGGSGHPQITLPLQLFGRERANSRGIDLSNEDTLRWLDQEFARMNAEGIWKAQPILADGASSGPWLDVRNPANANERVGQVQEAQAEDVERALASAHAHAMDWQAVAPASRAHVLDKAADLLEHHMSEFLALAVREAGKSLPNAIAEVREAVDFLRYYAAQVRGSDNALALGPVVCISPWNFPLAIFLGEVSAALAAGNVVLAKPAEQTPLIAWRAVQLLHEAGVPRAALQFLPGRGEVVGARLVADSRTRGVIFTGSTEVAQLINRVLAQRSVDEQTDIPLIAETGGQNAMIVDSSALPEQVVQDVITSAFDSAGQRCSALRVLFLQQEIADKTLTMLKGAMRELKVGQPDRLGTDIGPVIDTEAQAGLLRHIETMRPRARSVFQLELDESCRTGTFVAPTVIEIEDLSELKREVFGPVLHVIRYARSDLPKLVKSINDTGYGLTLGIHTRIDETIDFIIARAHVGNIYVNRNIVGAVVGVQPFGGEGKSGTGPKAGGPLYLKRLLRNGHANLHGHAIHAGNASASMSAHRIALSELIAWCAKHGQERVSTQAEIYLHESLLDSSLALPGPTGERNTLSFAPRGQVLCIARTLAGLLNQVFAALASGNTPCIAGDSVSLLPDDLPSSVRQALQKLSDIEQTGFSVALIEDGSDPLWRARIAAREGAIVPVLTMQAEQALPVWRLVAERALCVNTTAAGGNASLMTIGA